MNSLLWIFIVVSIPKLMDSREIFNIAVLYDGSSLNSDDLESPTVNISGTESQELEINFSYQNMELVNMLDSARKVCKYIQEGYAGFVTFLECPVTQYIDYYTSTFDIPTVIYMKYQCDLQKETSKSLKLTPHCFTKNQLLAKIVQFEKWSDIVIMYDNALTSRCLHDLLLQVSKLLTRSRLVNLKTSVNVTAALEDVKSLSGKHFVVMVDHVSVNDILDKADELDMLGDDNFWTIVEMKQPSAWIPSPRHIDGNIISVRQAIGRTDSDSCDVNPNKKSLPMALLYLQDAQALYMDALTRILQMTPRFTQTPTNCSGLKIERSESYERIVSSLMDTKVSGLTGEIKPNDEGYPAVTRYEICSQANTTNSSVEVVASWDVHQGLKVKHNKLFPNTFSSFGNRTLLIATQEARPFTIKSIVNGSVVFNGFCINILDELASRFKFRYQLIEPPDGLWGGPNDDGTWNGMVGMVRRGEVDFAIGPFTITSLREQVIDFTKPYMEDGAGIITKRPDGESDKMFQIFKPFATPVWACIAVSIVAVGVLLFIVNRFSPYTAYNRRLKDSSPDEISLTSNMWLIFGAFVEQGGVSFPTATSGRFILGFWWVFTILITSTYTANLAAYLTVTIAEKPINSLVELNAQEEIKPLVKIGTNLHSLFERAESGVYKKIWSQMSGMPIVKSADEALAYVRKGDTAFMTDRTQLEYIVLKDCVTYALADEIFNTAGYGFVLPENAPFMDIFNYNIMRMQEAGLIENWRQKWWPRSDSCSNSARTSSAQALGLDSLSGPFLVYVSVAGLSFICLVIEIIIQRCRKGDNKIPNLPSTHSNGTATNGTINNGFY